MVMDVMAAAARIEGSKTFAKEVMAAVGVRTARSELVDNPAHLDAVLDRFGPEHTDDEAWVVKDDGLAAGKGVVVTADRAAARAHAAGRLRGDRRQPRQARHPRAEPLVQRDAAVALLGRSA